jgi:sugar/nucleoside kinase (ribokinase family)
LKDYTIKDTTGAGDCFLAAFMVKYMELFEDSLYNCLDISEEE